MLAGIDTHYNPTWSRAQLQSTPLNRNSDMNSRAETQPLRDHFYFKERRGRIDWRLIATVDVNRVAREADIDTLQALIENLTFADIDTESQHRYADVEFIKIIRLCQLTVEYLLHVQDVLDAERNKLREANQAQVEDLTQLAAQNTKQKEEISMLKRDNHQKKKMIANLEMMLKMPASATRIPDGKVYKCPLCAKLFSTRQYLENHVYRRHPDQAHTPAVQAALAHSTPQSPPKRADESRAELEELRQLKMRLEKDTERIEKEMRVKVELQLASEREALKKKEEELDKAQQEQRLRYEEELRAFQSSLRKEFFETKLSFEQQHRRVEELRDQVAQDSKVRTGVGTLESDDDEVSRGRRANELREEIARKERAQAEREKEAAVAAAKEEFERQMKMMRLKAQKEKQQAAKELENERKKLELEKSKALGAAQKQREKLSQIETQMRAQKQQQEEALRRQQAAQRKQKKVEPVFKQEEEPEEVKGFQQEESDVSNDTTPRALSESYSPFPDKPFITSRFPHAEAAVAEERQGILADVSEELEHYGIPATGLTNKALKQQLEISYWEINIGHPLKWCCTYIIQRERDGDPEHLAQAEARALIHEKLESLVSTHYKPVELSPREVKQKVGRSQSVGALRPPPSPVFNSARRATLSSSTPSLPAPPSPSPSTAKSVSKSLAQEALMKRQNLSPAKNPPNARSNQNASVDSGNKNLMNSKKSVRIQYGDEEYEDEEDEEGDSLALDDIPPTKADARPKPTGRGAGTKVTSAIDEFDDDSFEGSLYEEPVVTKPRGNSIDKTSNPKGIDTESEEVNGLREDTELASFEISEDDEDLSLRDIVKTKAGAKGKIAEPPKKPSPRLNHNIVSDKGVSDDEDSDEIFGNGNAKKNVKMTSQLHDELSDDFDDTLEDITPSASMNVHKSDDLSDLLNETSEAMRDGKSGSKFSDKDDVGWDEVMEII